MSDATAIALAARSIAKVMRRALSQNDKTPEDQLLSFRTLCEVALPVLEQLAAQEESD
jgi:hypothetical protein